MPKALEELVMEELDVLYQGALFLSAGDRRGADDLLHDTATAAYRAGARSGGLKGPQPLERLMIRRYRERISEEARPLSGPKQLRPSRREATVTPEALFRAAGAVPSDARAALWLVVIRRWSYDDAAGALQIDREGLKDLLAYRDAFMSEALRSPGSLRRKTAE